MDSTEFINKLNEVQKFMRQESYKKAIDLIEKLKKLEKNGSFDYNLTHRLYQLDSNSRSLFNQQIILKTINILSDKYEYISFRELKQKLNDLHNLDLSEEILKREIEILILRNLLSCRIYEEKIVFN